MRINRVASCGLLPAILATANPAWAGADSTARSRSTLLAPAKQWDADRAAHLLRRAGFGGTPEQIEFLTFLGVEEAVDYLVDYQKVPLNDPDFVPISDPDLLRMREQHRVASDEQRKQTRRRLTQLHRRQLAQLQAWWLRRMILTSRPLEEKMTLFWHGHFTSGFREVKNSTWLWRQNRFLRQNALGGLRELLIGISRDPAMMQYLDAASNRKGQPNENYARELMELFTLGEGHYTERDVTEAARAFTGGRIGPDGFHVVRPQHDTGIKRVLGRRGRLDGGDVIDILLAEPATANHLARKLLVFFVEPEPADELVRTLAVVLRRSRYDFRKTMRVLLASEAFYAPQARHALIKSPVELIVGSVRLLEAAPADLYRMAFAARAMGQELFQPPNVKGWGGGATWITTATLFTRYNFAAGLLAGTNDREFERRQRRWKLNFDALADFEKHLDEYPGLSIPPVQVPLVRQPPYDPSVILAEAGLTGPGTSADVLVDCFVDRLLQRPITLKQRAALREIVGGSRTIDPTTAGGIDPVRRLIAVIMSMPEYQVN